MGSRFPEIRSLLNGTSNFLVLLSAVCDLMHGGSSVVLAAVSCSSALLLQSWAREHKIPTLIFPSQLCSPINFMDEMTVVLHTERSEYYRPTFELVQLLRGHEVAFILDEFHFESFGLYHSWIEIIGQLPLS